MSETRTEAQIEADRVDLLLFNLLHRCSNNEARALGKVRAWSKAARHIMAARSEVRALMHPKDLKGKA
jgi:hypothetical protein